MGKTKLSFSINLEALKSLDLTLEEYSVACIVKELMTDPESEMQGWSFYSKSQIAQELNVSESTVFRILQKLHAKGLVERFEKTQFLRTTKKWYQHTNGIPHVKLTSPMSNISKEKESNKEKENIYINLPTKVGKGSKDPTKPFGNKFVNQILEEHSKLTGLSQPTDKDPRKVAWNFHQRYGAENYSPALQYFQGIWKKVELTSIRSVLNNYPIYQRDVLKVSGIHLTAEQKEIEELYASRRNL